MPYECEISEDALPGTTVFDAIWVTDKDKVGENLNVTCLSQGQHLDACQMFVIHINVKSKFPRCLIDSLNFPDFPLNR